MNDFENVLHHRMIRENVNSRELHASLIWNDIADLDLHAYVHQENICILGIKNLNVEDG